jgi:hypothetical protein
MKSSKEGKCLPYRGFLLCGYSDAMGYVVALIYALSGMATSPTSNSPTVRTYQDCNLFVMLCTSLTQHTHTNSRQVPQRRRGRRDPIRLCSLLQQGDHDYSVDRRDLEPVREREDDDRVDPERRGERDGV